MPTKSLFLVIAVFLFWRIALGSEARSTFDVEVKSFDESTLHPCDDLPGTYHSWKSGAKNVDVVVVGGGVAGLTTVRELLKNKITNIVLLEADNYLGGRVKTYREGNILVETGAEWIHGEESNLLYVLATELDQVAPILPETAFDVRVLTENGIPSDPSHLKVLKDIPVCMDENIIPLYPNTSIGHCFVDRFPTTYGKGYESKLGKAWLHLLEEYVKYDEGTDSWFDGSARDAAQYADLGEDNQWKNGYDTIINYLKAAIPDTYVKLSTPVCRIIWDGINVNKALVVTKGSQSSYLADHVIFTASVGHLKERHQQLFQPSLPKSFLKDLSEIELGVADKVQIGWSKPWWGEKPLHAYILWTEFDYPADMEWMRGIVEVKNVHQQGSVLQAFVAGRYAENMENLPLETVKRHLLTFLSRVTSMKVPPPTFFRRTQWRRDIWKRGSYSSYVTVEGEKNGILNREPFKVPLKNSRGKQIVLWAGEHTHTTHFCTVDGAIESGYRVASEVMDLIGEGYE